MVYVIKRSSGKLDYFFIVCFLMLWDRIFSVFHAVYSSKIWCILTLDWTVNLRFPCSSIVPGRSSMLRGAYDKFPDFFVWALLLIVHTWNSSPLRSNLPRLQCTFCTVPKTSGRPHRSPLVWACQRPSSQPLSSPQLSHNNSLWA